MRKIKSSGNVFKDLGLPYPNTEMLRSQLILELFKIIKKENLTQNQAAKKYGVSQPELSRLKTGNHAHFTIDRILRIIENTGRKVQLKVN